MKFLIADDNAHNRLLMDHILSPYGRCDHATNGREAFEIFEMALVHGEPYSLVCLDIMMPKFDGHMALKKMRELETTLRPNDRETIIMMVTALDTEGHMVKAFLEGGCTDYLVKPVTKDKVIEKLRTYRLIKA
ncbi:MAG: response regulator [Magnetococcus sp. DMHC-1]